MMAKKADEIELHPDARQRFERAVNAVAKSPPQHRTKKESPRREAPKLKVVALFPPSQKASDCSLTRAFLPRAIRPPIGQTLPSDARSRKHTSIRNAAAALAT
jgi:hypothetical protein